MVCDRFSGQVFCRMSFCLGLAVCNAFFSQWLVGVVPKAIAFSPVHLLTPMLPFPGEGPPLHPQSYLPDLHFACPAYLSQQHPCAELEFKVAPRLLDQVLSIFCLPFQFFPPLAGLCQPLSRHKVKQSLLLALPASSLALPASLPR